MTKVLIGDITGPAGPQGPQGEPGTDGVDGAQGPQGEPGIPGANAVENDEAVSTYIATPGTQTRIQLEATSVELDDTPGSWNFSLRGAFLGSDDYPTPRRFGALGAGADETSKIQDMFDYIAESHRGFAFLPGKYYVPGGVSLDAPAVLQFAGGMLRDVDATFYSGLYTDALDTGVLSVTSPGVTVRNGVIAKVGAGAPTGGTGVVVNGGYKFLLDDMTIHNFHTLMSVTRSWYYKVINSHFFDPVQYGLLLTNAEDGDVGGGWIGGGTSFSCYNKSGRQATSYLRWESGGGLRVDGAKFNGRSERDPSLDFEAMPSNAIHCSIADGIDTVDILIQHCSIENTDSAAFNVQSKGPLNTGNLRNIAFLDNQIQRAGYGVYIHPELPEKRISEVLLENNIFENVDGNPIAVENVDRLHIGPNTYRNVLQQGNTKALVDIGANVRQVTYDSKQLVDGSNVYLYRNLSELLGGKLDTVEHKYSRDFDATSPSTYVPLYRVACPVYGAGTLTLHLHGRVEGVGPVAIRMVRTYTRGSSGALNSFATVGTDVVNGTGGSSVDVQFDTSTYGTSGAVQIRVKPNAGTQFHGRATVEIDGMVSVVARGEP